MNDLQMYPGSVYFDTQALLANGWPALSGAMLILLRDSKLLSIACVLPDPVLRELREHWLRDLHRERQQAAHLERRLHNVQLAAREAAPSDETLLEAYEAQVQRNLVEYPLHTCPTTSRPVVELFEHSVTRRLTFEEGKDAGFQDAVNLLSALDHSKGEIPAVFISSDRAFSSESTAAYLAASGKPFRIVKTIEAFQLELNQWLEMKRDLLLRIDRLTIAVAANKRRSELEQFARDRVAFFPFLHRPSRGRIVSFTNIRLGNVEEKDVRVNWVERTNTEAPLAITLNIPAEFDLTVERPGLYFPPRLKVGESVEPPTVEQMSSVAIPRVDAETWDARIEVDASTTVDDEDFSRLLFEDAKLRSLAERSPDA